MRKYFKHELLEPINMSEKYIDGQRFYQTPEGHLYKSVTTILGERTRQTRNHR